MNLIILIYMLLFIIINPNYNEFNLRTQDFLDTLPKQRAEKVYLQIDRNYYTSGDDIWFKAYVIDASTNRLSVNTNNLHLELIAPGSEIILKRTIRIERGIGHGDFHLSDSVPSGQYRIRSYTNHMRNYDDHFFFLRQITIINPYDEGEILSNKTKKIENKIDVSFFPEGGSLIDNVTSTVAFKAVDALGKGCDVTVKLFSSSGELITIFNSTHLGMGYFNIKPLPGFSYYTIVQSNDGIEIKAPLPESFPTGVAIRTYVTTEKKLILTVNTNEATLPSLIGNDFTINLSSRNLINESFKIQIDSLMNNFLMPVDSFPDGIIRITLSGYGGIPLCERLVFLQKNRDARLNISTDKNEYKPREKVTAKVSLSGDSSYTGIGNFSFSAAESRFTDNSSPFPRSIASWFLLESDVHGPIEEPSYYFDPSNEKRLQDLDLLLMTQGWRDFQWKYDSLSSFRHEIGFIISGNVKRIINNNPINGVKVNMGLLSKNSSLFLDTKTDKDGTYKFEELDIYGKTEAFISSTGKFERMQGRIFVDSVKYEPPNIGVIRPDTVELAPVKKDYAVLQQEAIIKINNLKKYKLSDTIELGEVIITVKRAETPQEVQIRERRRIYGTPDKELVVTPQMENYPGDVFSFISGRIAGVRVLRGINPYSQFYPNDVEIYIRGQFSTEIKKDAAGFKHIVKHGALILLDGYEVDTSSLISVLLLPMQMIDRIDVLNASSHYGMRGANGVINIITRTGIRREPEKLSPNSVYITVRGFDVPRIFYSPKYYDLTNQTFIPDYRATIFWKPDIVIEKNSTASLEYYNADKTTTINLTVEGMTNEGIPLTGIIKYEVK